MYAMSAQTYKLPNAQSNDTFDLFVQRLYTRTYAEKVGRVRTFSGCATVIDSLTVLSITQDGTGMDWGVKAAILAWE
jgi:hypothetical protein